MFRFFSGGTTTDKLYDQLQIDLNTNNNSYADEHDQSTSQTELHFCSKSKYPNVFIPVNE